MGISNDSSNSLLQDPEKSEFYDDIVDGMLKHPRSLPCKYFYDQRGSELFDQICELEEYYLTRTELAIMQRYSDQMADQIGSDAMLIEYGSGSSIKTRLLLEHLDRPAAYVPVDISGDHLEASAADLARQFPHIQVLPVCADFTQPFQLSSPSRQPSHNAVYFPGSTIGNFTPDAAKVMLKQIVQQCGCGGGLLIGIDLQKDVRLIEAAYNDSKEVTAAFNLNLLRRINRDLDADFDLEHFEHDARYDESKNRIEISLVSQKEQMVTLGNQSFLISDGEFIRTEFSHKYTIEGFAAVAREAGLTLRRHWTDSNDLFAVLHLVALGD